MTAQPDQSSDLLTADELAARLRVSTEHVYRQCRGQTPKWPCYRIGRALRFSPEHVAQIEQLLEAPRPRRAPRTSTKTNDVARALNALAPA